MVDRPVETLVERIDAALARIERSIARNQADMRALEHRHQQLKATVAATLGEIDALIARGSE